jgi:hypothetical protein
MQEHARSSAVSVAELRGERVELPVADVPQAAHGRRRFALNGATPLRVGMEFDPVLPFEVWTALGRQLAKHETASCWWLGDWLAYGEYKYGRRYKRGVAITGLDYQTLRNYAAVARRFVLSRRRDGLSFQHHAELCALADEEQDRWLDRAGAQGWSRNELRRRLRKQLSRSAGPTVLVRLAVDTDRRCRWQEAAARTACEFEAWMIRMLDEAAAHVLNWPRPAAPQTREPSTRGRLRRASDQRRS